MPEYNVVRRITMPEYTVWTVLERGDHRVDDEHVITFTAETDEAAIDRFEDIRIKAQ